MCSGFFLYKLEKSSRSFGIDIIFSWVTLWISLLGACWNLNLISLETKMGCESGPWGNSALSYLATTLGETMIISSGNAGLVLHWKGWYHCEWTGHYHWERSCHWGGEATFAGTKETNSAGGGEMSSTGKRDSELGAPCPQIHQRLPQCPQPNL